MTDDKLLKELSKDQKYNSVLASVSDQAVREQIDSIVRAFVSDFADCFSCLEQLKERTSNESVMISGSIDD